jgi:predicted nuclease of predicted toxin-antitoxin system
LRLLFDQNLSFRLVRLLDDLYPDSVHVRDVSLREAGDAELWRHAAEHGLTIVSKDSDFHLMSTMYGPPPKVVWLRIGNGPAAAAADLLRQHYGTMEQFHADSEAAFLALG